MKKPKYKTIGIMGGQGPASTTDLYMRIIHYCRKNFRARKIKDYPPVIIYSVPTPDLIYSVEDERKTFSIIKRAAKSMQSDGCDFIIVACNSLQIFMDKLRKNVNIPVIGMAEILTDYVKVKQYKKLGILATSTTIKREVYSKPLKKESVNILVPSAKDQKDIENIISGVIAGNISREYKLIIKRIIQELKNDGAEAVLLACTEIPLVISQQDTKIPLIDCSQLYAEKTVRLLS